MKTNFKRVLCSLIALVMVLSVAFLPTLTANAAETLTEFTHPESPTATDNDKALLEELKAIHPSHIYSYDASEFRLMNPADTFQPDEGAYNGKAALLFAAARTKDGVNCMVLDDHGLPLIMVDPYNGASNFAIIETDSIIADGNYHLYKLDDQVPILLPEYKFLLLFADWTFQLPTLPADLTHMMGKPMDMYFSIKVTGDIRGTDPYNLPTWYIDRVIITEACEAYGIEFADGEAGTCMTNATKVGTCPKCNATVVKEVEYSMVPHSYTNYVAAEDGSQVAECDFGCGKTDVIEPETEPKETEAPATEPDETEAPAADENEDNTGDTTTTGPSTGMSPIAWVIIAVIVVLVAGAAFVAVKFLRKKE